MPRRPPAGSILPVVAAADDTPRSLVDLLFERAGGALCLLEPDGRVRRANEAWLRRCPPGELAGREVGDLFPQERDRVRALVERARRGETVEIPPGALRAGGASFWEGTLSPVVEDGEARVLIEAREVAGRGGAVEGGPAADAQLTAAEVEAILPALDDAVLVYDADMRVRRSNAAFLARYGFDPVGLDVKEIGERVSCQWLDGSPFQWEDQPTPRAVRGERVAGARFRVRPPGGREMAVETSSGPLRIGDRVAGTVTVWHDITERTRAEKELRESELRLRLFVEHVPAAVAMFDRDMRYLAVSRRFLTDYRLGERDIVGRSHYEVFPGLPERWRDIHRRCLAGAVEKCAEDSFLRADGSVEWVAWEIHPWTSGDQIGGIVLFSEVITERKQAEAALLEADRRKDEFLSVLSHELRNPLAPLRNAAHVLERAEPAGSQARRAREIIGRQVAQLTRLVDDLLDVTRVARGKAELKKTLLDLAAVVRLTVEDHRALFDDRGIGLEFRAQTGPVWVNGDMARLSQVVGNLLANAAKFTDPGGHVVVSVGGDGKEAHVSVRDDGVGIAPEVLMSLFTPFTQARRTLDRTRGGLGVGLALVKGIAELHGGSARAQSPGEGGGAEFSISLPSAPAPEGGVAAPTALSPAERRRVLIIDDNGDAAETLRDVLEMDGHEVAIARDGPSGVEAGRLLRPDVILCDLGLPGLSGYEVARRLREGGHADGVTLVALTGHGLPADVARTSAAGFRHHVVKPADLDALRRILSEAPRRVRVGQRG